MQAPADVRAALDRLVPLAEAHPAVKVALALGSLTREDMDRARAVLDKAEADGLNDAQCARLVAALDTPEEQAEAVNLLAGLGPDARPDVLLVLGWALGEIRAGGTAPEPVVSQPEANHSTPSNSSTPAEVLEDGYTPTSGLPRAKIVCRAWGQRNDGQREVSWSDNRHWKSRTASNGKVLDAILFVFIVRDGRQIASRRLDHVAVGKKSKGLGNMFFDPADPYHAGNPFCDTGVRPRPGDQWAMVLTNQSGSERSTVTPLAAWRG